MSNCMSKLKYLQECISNNLCHKNDNINITYYQKSALDTVREYLMKSIDNDYILLDDVPIVRRYVDVMCNLMLEEINKTKSKVNEKPNIYDVILYSEDITSDMKVKLLKVLENKLNG